MAKILAIDSKVILDPLEDALVESGHEVIRCEDGAEAISVFAETQPDLVLLELLTPGKDGFLVLQELVEKSDTPVVIVSVKSEIDFVERALELGAADYIKKPYGKIEILRVIESILGENK
jgi:DNA-binding response OmpR family regulator